MSKAGWHSDRLNNTAHEPFWAWHHASPCALFPAPSPKAFHSCVSIWIAGAAIRASVWCMWRYHKPKAVPNTLCAMWAFPSAHGQIPEGNWKIANGIMQHELNDSTCQRGCWKISGLQSAWGITVRPSSMPNITCCLCKLNSWSLLHNENRKRSIMCHKG